MTEIAIRQPAAIVAERDVVDGWITVAADVSKLADYIAETDFVPKALRNRPAAVAACILTGRELGIGPMASLKSIHMVQGVPSLSAEYKRARALAAGHEIVVDESNSSRCVIRGRRAASDRWLTITWTMDMARRAKISGKDVWLQYPQRMLQARASSELCDMLFPDATLGLETTEILEDGGVAVAAAIAIEAAAEDVQPDPKPARTTRRARTAGAPDPTHVSAAGSANGSGTTPPDAPAPSAPPARTNGDQPPLPGEDETPADGAPDDTDYGTPGTATRGKGGQLTAIWTVLSTVYGFGDGEKPQARKVCEHIISRQLVGGTTGNLSYSEARTVLDTLAALQVVAEGNGVSPREQLIALLAESEASESA